MSAIPVGSPLEKFVEALCAPNMRLSRTDFNDRCHKLSMEWPSLAAAIGDMLDENGVGVPGPLRHAQNVLRQERDHSTR